CYSDDPHRPLHSFPTRRSSDLIFASQRPFQITGVIANPIDGALYAITGGRGTESQLYRFTYTGTDSTAAPQPTVDAAAVEARERSEEHTSELQSQSNLVCRLLL